MEFAAAGFWLFLCIVVAALVWRTTMIKRERIATIRAAIEKGQPVDDELMSILFKAGSDRAPRLKSRPGDVFLVSGALLVALGLCFGLMAAFVPEWQPFALLALVSEVVAATFLVLWRLFSRRGQEGC